MAKEYTVKITKLPKSSIKMEVSIETGKLTEARKKALKHFSEKIEIDGFRKGLAPESVILKNIGEDVVLEEASDILVNEYFPIIVEEEKLKIIGRPKVVITKVALNNPLEFTAEFAVLPEFKLPDYEKIAKEENSKPEDKNDVTDKEIDDVLLQIRKNKAHFDWHRAQKERDPEPVEGPKNPDETDHSKHPDYENEDNLPKMDDALAQAAGNFKNLEELKAKVKENIAKEKDIKSKEKRRGEIMEALVKATDIEIPEILVESEIQKSFAQMQDDIERMGGKVADYLAHIKKTEAELKEDFREGAEKRAKVQLILDKIVEVEKIVPNKEIMDNEVKQLMEQYPESREENVRIYVEMMLLNAEVLKMLENIK